ncbi:EAL domain-containing protein [Bacillus alkalicellulosilyticus]|uniref:bifunctional diguanylate cyclase/phosphodiesterase n=1 Tax=Alkalihalobacterium alkalicellulosilyticum TaxID=1912214 RepID=UPI000998580B|nr:EAL domain-containing protein [Bacillus alkalicellulosilyticus]
MDSMVKSLWLTEQFNRTATHIFDLLSNRIGINTFFIATNDRKDNVVLKSINRQYSLMVEGSSLPFENVLCRFVCENIDEPFVISDLANDPRTKHEPATKALNGSGCFVGVPIVLRNGDVFGTLCGLDKVPYDFTDEDISLLRSLGSLLSVTVELERMSKIDEISNLYTVSFIKSLFSKLATEEGNLGLLCVDIDHFKKVNEVYGYEVGDQLLKLMAERLQAVFSNQAFGCRFSADEYLFIFTSNGTVSILDEIQVKFLEIQHALLQPFYINGHECYLTCSIGVSVYPNDGQEFDLLIRNAHNTMNRSKEGGRNALQFFTKAHFIEKEQHLDLEQGLYRALNEKQLFIEYQPQYDLKDERMVGMEALLRWQHPLLGRVSPASFIPITEENGLIVSIGKWILREVCIQGKTWVEKGIDFNEISINISIRQLKDRNFLSDVRFILDETGFEPAMLKFEITESMFIQDTLYIKGILLKLNELGINISLDDFGTGYSSLSILGTLPLHTIKIDRSFVTGMKESEKKQNIVKSIISLAKALHIFTLAEGIESEDETHILHGLGCSYAQGYYYSKPVSPKAIESLLFDQS